jgi:hypothetical protein
MFPARSWIGALSALIRRDYVWWRRSALTTPVLASRFSTNDTRENRLCKPSALYILWSRQQRPDNDFSEFSWTVISITGLFIVRARRPDAVSSLKPPGTSYRFVQGTFG